MQNEPSRRRRLFSVRIERSKHLVKQLSEHYDLIVIGSGIGGLAAAALRAKAGERVLVLEANYLPGGCCSSYWRKGYVFETGATTLMGFDEGQPLHKLFQELEPQLEMRELAPAMTVWMEGEPLVRYKDRETWIRTAGEYFGQPEKQRKFWSKLLQLSDFVWRASGKNLRFPPASPGDLFSLLKANPPADLPKPFWSLVTTERVLGWYGLADDQRFRRFLDEQLMITAQATAAKTPFLFAAPALCYTNYSNYYLPGGMIQLPAALIQKLGEYHGDLRLRRAVQNIRPLTEGYLLTDQHGATYLTRKLLSNLPIWNLPQVTQGDLKQYFEKQSAKNREYWGAVTMGIVLKPNSLPEELTLHHQLHLPPEEAMPHTGSHSIFVSLSAPDDTERAPNGERVLAVSTHAHAPENWHNLSRPTYQARKAETEAYILQQLEAQLPGFRREDILLKTISTPKSWEDWIYRHEGTVGGIPQDIRRPIFTWQGALTPFHGFYLCGDTVYPGQGVPGVALGGIIAAQRIGQAANPFLQAASFCP